MQGTDKVIEKLTNKYISSKTSRLIALHAHGDAYIRRGGQRKVVSFFFSPFFSFILVQFCLRQLSKNKQRMFISSLLAHTSSSVSPELEATSHSVVTSVYLGEWSWSASPWL